MKIIETKVTHPPIISTRLWNRCNQMPVAVEDRLSGILAIVHAYVETGDRIVSCNQSVSRFL